jgi:hypothetical protein
MKLVARLSALTVVAACSTQVKQAHAPRAEEFAESGDSDMAAAPEKGPAPIIKSAAEVRRNCCQQCTDAAAKDKTGDDPAKIPCADFTAELKEECLNLFRKTPLMAAAAKACAAEPAPAAPKE